VLSKSLNVMENPELIKYKTLELAANAEVLARYLLGDEQFDADYWVTRIENEPTASVLA